MCMQHAHIRDQADRITADTKVQADSKRAAKKAKTSKN